MSQADETNNAIDEQAASMVEKKAEDEAQSEGSLPLYDAKADQRIPFHLETDDGLALVHFILGPQTETVLVEHERQLNLRIAKADREETGGVFAIKSKSKKVEADSILFDTVAIKPEGFGDSDEDIPGDWKDHIHKQDKSDVIATYLAAEVVKPEVQIITGRASWNYRSGIKTHILRVLFEGYQLELKHTLGPSSADQLDEFKAITTQSYQVQGAMVMQGESLIPARLKRMGVLYQQLHQAHEGYKGYPPLHHQAEIVAAHLSPVLEALRKKPNASQGQSS